MPSENDEIAALKAALAAQSAELEATRAALEEARSGTPSPARPAARPAPRWRESDSGAWTCAVGRAVTRGEERLAALPWPDGWLLAFGFEIADHTRTREVDALVIAPGGVLVIEQKDTAARGRLELTANGPALVDGVEVPRLSGALRQARLPAQMLSTALREHGVRGGYVSAMLSIHGRVTLRAEQIGGVHVVPTAQLVRAAASLLKVRDPEETLTAGTVLGVLNAVGLPLTGLPPLTEIGFPETTW
ncbi:nuclease-related domain-containing protein [Nocardioides sp.]|uniref:nuclease-related domain-containing protein n=1 Tax=Nocardioides sp. TaxID=35761 RepID=UPI00262637C9|nr:nuclease-related domain-containing protein [Nocardioides sp.]